MTIGEVYRKLDEMGLHPSGGDVVGPDGVARHYCGFDFVTYEMWMQPFDADGKICDKDSFGVKFDAFFAEWRKR